MREKTASVHPLFDPSSLYGRMRACVRAEDKMRGYFHYLWARLKREPQPLPVPEGLTREEGLRWARRLAGICGVVNGVAFSADGRRVVTGSGDETAKVWDAEDGRELLTLKGHTDWVTSVAFSADGRRVLTGSRDATAKVWDAEDGREILTLKGHRHTSVVTGVACSADGRRVLTGNTDNTAKVWDAEDGRELLTLKGHNFFVSGVAFSADGRRVLTGSGDATAKVWDAEDGREILTLKGHTDWVTSVAFSADGRRVVTGSWDETAKVWDAEDGRELLTLKGHTASVRGVAFSADGRRVLTGSEDNTAKVWDAETAEVRIVVEHGPDFRVLSVWRASTLVVWPENDSTPTTRSERHDSIDLCLVREADGKLTLGGLARPRDRDHVPPRRCRAFLLEPEVVERLKALLGDRPWTDAFHPQTVADNFEVAQILSAVPEMEEKPRRPGEIVFDRVAVSERYDVLPPRREPLQVVIVIDPAT